MSETDNAAETTTPDELRADIQQTRAALADSVDALSAKLDVKSRIEPYRGRIAAGAVAAIVVFVVVRRRR
jgi:hypothetical protein